MSVSSTTPLDSQMTLHSDGMPSSPPNVDLPKEKKELNPASPTGPEKESNGETADEEEWKFSTRALLIFVTLATLTLMAALDGTSISVALPVRFLPP
jgi:hypothetical protein